MRKIDEILLKEILPPSIAGDGEVDNSAEALDGELLEVEGCIREALIVSRIDELPEELVDLLAWQWHVDFYPPDLSLTAKRNLVRSSIPWHRKKGTLWAVKRLCEDVFGKAEVTEWYQYGGTPYRFRVATEGRLSTEEAWRLFFQSLDHAKNTRSWLDEVTILRPLNNDIRYAHPLCTKGAASIDIERPAPASQAIHYGICQLKKGAASISPAPVDRVENGHYLGIATRRSGCITLSTSREGGL